MTNFTPTPEQRDIIDELPSSTDGLLVDALAGTGKTGTLVLLAEAWGQPLLSLAFNKRAKEELEVRMPSRAEVKTIHGLGYGAVKQMLSRSVRVDSKGDKLYQILKALIEKSGQSDALWENFSDLKSAINFGMEHGWVPQGKFDSARPLLDNDEFFSALSETDWGWAASPTEERIIIKAAEESIDLALRGHISYPEMVLIPTIFPATFPAYPLVMPDEVQDFSKLNHIMLRKLMRKHTRLVAVGDPCQSIYGFRGAYSSSMSKLQHDFDLRTFPLSVSFRCSRAVADHVRWRAPNIKSPEWAKPGRVTYLDSWNASDIPNEAFVLCRNNAPLFVLALRLIRSGRRPKIVGGDVMRGIEKELKKLGSPTDDVPTTLASLTAYREKLIARYGETPYVEDKIATLQCLIEPGNTLGHALTRARELLSQSGPIELMTIHKAKGLEAEHVFILDPELFRKGEQEDNLRYVGATRARDTLTYITTEGWNGG